MLCSQKNAVVNCLTIIIGVRAQLVTRYFLPSYFELSYIWMRTYIYFITHRDVLLTAALGQSLHSWCYVGCAHIYLGSWVRNLYADLEPIDIWASYFARPYMTQVRGLENHLIPKCTDASVHYRHRRRVTRVLINGARERSGHVVLQRNKHISVQCL